MVGKPSGPFGTKTDQEKIGDFDFALRREAMSMLKHKNGIIVDPNAASRSALRAMLSSIGMAQVGQAAGAVDALRRVKERPADIILCDYLLDDGRDGQQLLEEMRSRRLIPLSTAFIVITRERRYQSVVSVAELAPDDYLLKPFTPQQLLERLEAVLQKKHAFRHAHAHLGANEIDAAITACDRISSRFPQYQLDALRLKAETLLIQGRIADAEALYREILAHRAVPWAKMGLAIAAESSGNFDEAADLVLEVIEHHPNFVAAYDLAAKVEEARGHQTEAQRHLEAAVYHAPHSLLRQRRLGRLATENGDLAVAEVAMAKVVSRGSGSGLRQAADYAELARLQIASGKAADALATVTALRRDMRDDPGASMIGHAMTALAHAKLGNSEQAAAAARSAMAEAHAGDELQAHLLVDVAQSLLITGNQDAGVTLLRRAIAVGEGDDHFDKYMHRVLAGFDGAASVVRGLQEDVRQQMIRVNNEGVRLGQAGHLNEAIALFRETIERMPSLQMYANAAKAILAKLNRDGWDDTLAEEARGYMHRAARQSPLDSRLTVALDGYRQVAAKYGIRVEGLPEGGGR